ncbi:MAG: sodium-dependent transporter [Clostridia bacterium]|nr:sodium-dependent transporter [Clostridia bacterium]
MQREKFTSRLGFILISAGCAIGLGNVWRFPYIVGQYGGATFILIYLLFLLIFGLPIMTMEFSVGRGSQKSIMTSFAVLEPKGTKWHAFGWVGLIGNYLLMMFYTTVSGWMFAYVVKMIKGNFSGLEPTAISAQFSELTANPWIMAGYMLLVVVVGFLICSLGLEKGVERITKVMMLALLGIIVILAVRAVTLPGAAEGIKYYLLPNLDGIKEHGWGEVIFAALGQAFFTLSIGMGSMAIFGSYIGKNRRLMGESISVAALDTFVAFMAGMIIIPACFAYGINPSSGPGLVFETLPNIFNAMPMGRLWGALFFVFMVFAAMSTVIAVFENIISCGCDKWGWSRKKSCLINGVLILVLSLPCVLGFNVWSNFAPLGEGTNIMDLEDFIISNNILPLGCVVYVLFCTLSKKGWGYKKFINEANSGTGAKFPTGQWMYIYAKWILPVLLIIFWAQGIISKFF